MNPQALFQLGVPEIIGPAAPDGKVLSAEVQLGLEDGRVELQLFTDAVAEVTVVESGV